MSGCAFCKIARESAEKAWVLWHADGEVFSIKPFGAVVPMHRMFIPVRHVVSAADSPEITGLCFEMAAQWAAGKDKPFNLVVNSGREAGQSVFHLHIHYVPRSEGDGLGYRWQP